VIAGIILKHKGHPERDGLCAFALYSAILRPLKGYFRGYRFQALNNEGRVMGYQGY
jgi:hypothetical protein